MDNSIKQVFENARKIVIKIGSNTLANQDGKINLDFMNELASQCAELIKAGKQIVLVSSGAQVAGVSTLDRWARKKDIHYRQALCAIGQVELMDHWRKAFSQYGYHIGQLLLTKEDFLDPHRTLNMRNTLFTLVDEGVVPIINENDTIATEEIKVGDNDTLSAMVSVNIEADLLILMSDIDGLYTKDPHKCPDAELIHTVPKLTPEIMALAGDKGSSLGTGGMKTKLSAAEICTEAGCEMIIMNGEKPDLLYELFDGNEVGTRFLAR